MTSSCFLNGRCINNIYFLYIFSEKIIIIIKIMNTTPHKKKHLQNNDLNKPTLIELDQHKIELCHNESCLSKGSDCYKAIKQEVKRCWELHHEDVTKWPKLTAVYDKLESVLIPYAATDEKRKRKCRTRWNEIRFLLRRNSKNIVPPIIYTVTNFLFLLYLCIC